MEEGDNKNEETKQAYSEPQLSKTTWLVKSGTAIMANSNNDLMTECIKNHQTKNHFVHDQKHAKKD